MAAGTCAFSGSARGGRPRVEVFCGDDSSVEQVLRDVIGLKDDGAVANAQDGGWVEGDLDSGAARKRYGSLVVVAFTTGLRRGELAGLKWSDIGFERATATVARAVVQLPGTAALVKATKIGSVATIALSVSAIDAVRGQRAFQAQDKLRAGGSYDDQGFVFTNELGGIPVARIDLARDPPNRSSSGNERARRPRNAPFNRAVDATRRRGYSHSSGSSSALGSVDDIEHLCARDRGRACRGSGSRRFRKERVGFEPTEALTLR